MQGKRKWVQNDQTISLPSVRVLVREIHSLLHFIYLPTSDGGRMEQKVEFIGLPNQCCYRKQVSHFVNDCERRRDKMNKGKGAKTQLNVQDHLQGNTGLEQVFNEKGKNVDLGEKGEEWQVVGRTRHFPPLVNSRKDKSSNIVSVSNRFEELQEEVNLMEVSKECSNGVPPKGGECPLMLNE